MPAPATIPEVKQGDAAHAEQRKRSGRFVQTVRGSVDERRREEEEAEANEMEEEEEKNDERIPHQSIRPTEAARSSAGAVTLQRGLSVSEGHEEDEVEQHDHHHHVCI